MKCPEVWSHGEDRALYRIAGIIKIRSRILRRKLEIKSASHIHCNHLATLRFIAISAETLLKMAVNKMSDMRGCICFILYYMCMIYVVYTCCKQCHWKVGEWQWWACLPDSLLRHNTTPQNPLIEQLFFLYAESLLRFGPAQSARSVSSALVETFYISPALPFSLFIYIFLA